MKNKIILAIAFLLSTLLLAPALTRAQNGSSSGAFQSSGGANLASPGPIGGTAPGPGTFTTQTSSIANGCYTVNGVAYSNVQAAMTAAGVNGLACVPSTYAGVDVPAGTQIQNTTIPASSSQPAGFHDFDYRYGATAESYFNPTFSQFGNFNFAHSIIVNLTTNLGSPPNNSFGFGVQQNVYDGGTNLNNGTYSNKSNYEASPIYLNGWAQGQHIGTASIVNGYGAGDNLANSAFVECFGGSTAGGDEGCALGDVSVSQGHVAAVGTIASGASTGATSLTFSFSAGGGTQGAGRYLIDTTLASSTGNVTTIAGTGPTTYTFSGVALSTDTITTSTSAVTAPGVATLNIPTTTGIVANTTLVCVADTATFECVIPTAVSANVSITANFRKPHLTSASVAWGGMAGNLIELNIDRGPSSGQYNYITVTNLLRQAWPIIGCATATTCQVWRSTAGGYGGAYTGLATIAAGSNAYTIYPGAEIVSVQSGGTVSNTITLAPNNVAWANGNAIEVPLYPGQKMALYNGGVNQWWPDAAGTALSSGFKFNGRFCCGTSFWTLNFAPFNVTDYNGYGGKLIVPTAFVHAVGGPTQYGMLQDIFPAVAMVAAGCPFDGTGVQNCTVNADFSYAMLQANGNGGGDFLYHNPGAKSWIFTTNNNSKTFRMDANGNFTASGYILTNLLASVTTPTIAAAGCGGGAASILVSNGTAAFKIGVGTTPGSSCTITMPAATTGWNCHAEDITTVSTLVFLQKQTGVESTTSVTFTNFSDVGAATAYVANDVLKVICSAD
jgi:hypothetical protein